MSDIEGDDLFYVFDFGFIEARAKDFNLGIEFMVCKGVRWRAQQ